MDTHTVKAFYSVAVGISAESSACNSSTCFKNTCFKCAWAQGRQCFCQCDLSSASHASTFDSASKLCYSARSQSSLWTFPSEVQSMYFTHNAGAAQTVWYLDYTQWSNLPGSADWCSSWKSFLRSTYQDRFPTCSRWSQSAQKGRCRKAQSLCCSLRDLSRHTLTKPRFVDIS